MHRAPTPSWVSAVIGTRISMLLGPVVTYPDGQRAVNGRVVGFAPRSAEYVDIELDRILTWVYGGPALRIEELPAEWSCGFRVRLSGALATTFADLSGIETDGRGLVEAREIRRIYCPGCRKRCGEGKYCAGCGRRVRLEGRGTHRCAMCGGEGIEVGHCEACGAPAKSPELDDLVGRRVELEIVARRRRYGRISATVDAIGIEPPVPGAPPCIVARIRDVTAGGTPVEELATVVAIHGVDPKSLAQRGRSAGTVFRASELKRPCSRCADWEHPEQERTVLTRYCPTCGSRARIFDHPDATRRVQRAGRRTDTHSCGSAYLEVEDLYCGGCGAELAGFDSGDERFLWVS